MTPQSQKPPASQTLLAIRDLLDDSGAPGCDLMRAFVEHRDEIDVETATYLMRCLIGVVAVETGETPRTILEREFGLAPSDQFWRGDLTPAPRKLPAAQ